VGRKHHRKSGFSLLELLTVMVILGIFAAVSTPTIGRILNSITVRKKTASIMATLRYARLMSISKGQKVHVMLDRFDGTVIHMTGAIEEDRVVQLDAEDSLTMMPESITFYPESRVSPATLSIILGNQSREIILDPFTALPVIN
jgi:type II secretion system protein H